MAGRDLCLLVGLCLLAAVAASEVSWLVKTTRDSPDHITNVSKGNEDGSDGLEISTLHIRSNIQYRYATTIVYTQIGNQASTASQVRFRLDLPERAFISSFLIEIDGNEYKAYVKERAEAEKEYQEAVQAGNTAGQVATSTRDSNLFVVSVNIEPKSKVSFNLTYEELLDRRLSLYNHVLTLTPEQVVNDLRIDVYINETSNITTLIVSTFGNKQEADGNEDRQESRDNAPLASITRLSSQSAHIHFAPSQEQQQSLLSRLNTEDAQHQLSVQYDVDRSLQAAGEVLLMDGYFVHFFAPRDISPLPKHVIFVLDTSGSMWGRKIEQLQNAMAYILDSLKSEDYFSLVQFGTDVEEWSSHSQDIVGLSTYSATHEVNKINIEKAKLYIKSMNVTGGTNINGALRKSIQLAAKQQYDMYKSDPHNRPKPILLFLTDGIPTVGELRTYRILGSVRALNTETQVSIFSLAFGEGANFRFLKKLSLQNNGFARKIYEAADSSLQLQSFYEEISSPVLANVNFTYVNTKIEKNSVTKTNFHTYFSGSEIIIAGKVKIQDEDDSYIGGDVTAYDGENHQKIYKETKGVQKKANSNHQGPSVVERLWAYLTIKQLLDQQIAGENTTTDGSNQTMSPKDKALKLALKYGFVTPLTSLVVVKPVNGSNSTQTAEETLGDEKEDVEISPFQDRILSVPMYTSERDTTMKPAHQPVAELTEQPPAQSSPHSEPNLTLEDLTWLPQHLVSNGHIKVTTNDSRTDGEVEFLVDISQNAQELESMPVESCTTPQGDSGSCLPLAKCVLKDFAEDYHVYLKFFCPIGKYAGVCCPKLTAKPNNTTIDLQPLTQNK